MANLPQYGAQFPPSQYTSSSSQQPAHSSNVDFSHKTTVDQNSNSVNNSSTMDLQVQYKMLLARMITSYQGRQGNKHAYGRRQRSGKGLEQKCSSHGRISYPKATSTSNSMATRCGTSIKRPDVSRTSKRYTQQRLQQLEVHDHQAHQSQQQGLVQVQQTPAVPPPPPAADPACSYGGVSNELQQAYFQMKSQEQQQDWSVPPPESALLSGAASSYVASAEVGDAYFEAAAHVSMVGRHF